VLGISGGDPSFRNDDGSARPEVVTALAEFAAGSGSERAVLTALSDSRLLVPVVAVLADQPDSAEPGPPVRAAESGVGREKASADSSGVVVDVAGPIPFAVEGASLAALARGEAAPAPYDDPDVHEIVAAVLANRLDVASFELQADDSGHDLAIVLVLSEEVEAGASDIAQLGADVAEAVMARLGGRLPRGIAIWRGSHSHAS